MPEEDRWSCDSKKGRSSCRGNSWDVDEIIREMEEMMEKELESLSKKAPEDPHQERTLPDGTKVKSWGPFVYGYSVTVGPDGKPKVRKFGNFKTEPPPEQPHMDDKKEQEPLVDVIPADGEVRVIVELPGVEKEDIKVSGTEDKLTISVDTPECKYFKEVELPAKVNVKKATSKYKNGVLDIIVPKRKKRKPKARP